MLSNAGATVDWMCRLFYSVQSLPDCTSVHMLVFSMFLPTSTRLYLVVYPLIRINTTLLEMLLSHLHTTSFISTHSLFSLTLYASSKAEVILLTSWINFGNFSYGHL